jgi:hypothetical protein
MPRHRPGYYCALARVWPSEQFSTLVCPEAVAHWGAQVAMLRRTAWCRSRGANRSDRRWSGLQRSRLRYSCSRRGCDLPDAPARLSWRRSPRVAGIGVPRGPQLRARAGKTALAQRCEIHVVETCDHDVGVRRGQELRVVYARDADRRHASGLRGLHPRRGVLHHH